MAQERKQALRIQKGLPPRQDQGLEIQVPVRLSDGPRQRFFRNRAPANIDGRVVIAHAGAGKVTSSGGVDRQKRQLQTLADRLVVVSKGKFARSEAQPQAEGRRVRLALDRSRKAIEQGALCCYAHKKEKKRSYLSRMAPEWSE